MSTWNDKQYIIDWSHFRKRLRPRIEMLTNEMGWDIGNRFTIFMEDKYYLYFYDVFFRWTAISKEDEHKEFIFIRYKRFE
jgi:hypothetical protein